MKRLMLGLAAALTFSTAGVALADDEAAALRQPAIDRCSDNGKSNLEPCTCLADHVTAQFGDDAIAMLKILGAGLQPSDTAAIAALLGVTEDEAKVIVARLDEKMDGAVAACMPQ